MNDVNCPADYFKYFSISHGIITDKSKKNGHILYNILNQLDGLTCSQINTIFNNINYIIKEKQDNNIIKF